MGENRALNTRFKMEEIFSKYIKENELGTIGAIIGKTINAETALLEQKAEYEQHKGTLRVDILAESVEGTYIAIENQFFKSNHEHFGKLFTYATMFWTEEKPVTDVVWIVEKVRREHYDAVNTINNLLEEKKVNFRIWLLVAKLDDNDNVIIDKPLQDDFFQWGDKVTNDQKNKEKLDQFMPELMEYIRELLPAWNEPRRADSTPHCITVTNRNKAYSLNIVFRTGEKWFKIEAKFDKGHNQYYKKEVLENWDNIIETLEYESFDKSVEEYSIAYDMENKNYVKIYGLFPADIENETNWSFYKEKALDLLPMIIQIADLVPKC